MLTPYDPLLIWSQQHKVNFVKIDKRYKRPKENQFKKHQYTEINLRKLKSMEAVYADMSKNYQDIQALASWVVEYLPYKAYYLNDTIYFSSALDATMFALRWT